MPFLILVALFVIIPIAEISLLLKVGSAIGGLNTVLFVIFTAVLGAHLVRQQGFATLAKLQQEMNSGRLPALQIAEGVALLFAGAVLLTPGFITDAIGFLLLVPFTRRIIVAIVAKRFAKNGSGFNFTSHTATGTHGSGSARNDRPNVIEGEYTEPDDTK